MFYSDLIDECLFFKMENSKVLANRTLNSVKIKYNSFCDFYTVKDLQDIEYFGKEKGDYFLINRIDFNKLNSKRILYYTSILTDGLCEKFLSKRIKNILIVGLGNPNIQCDSLGSKVCDYLSNYISKFNNLFIFKPDVFGKTGFESFEIVKCLVELKKIDCVLVIDSLCANSPKRLSSSIQVTNSGISPGSGIMNKRKRICEKDLGVNVIAIGVPLMIFANSFVKNTFEDDNEINNIIKNLIVCDTNISENIDKFSQIISSSIIQCLIKISKNNA